MKIAIPIFGKDISPRFDGAQFIVLLTVEGEKVVDREKWRTQNLNALALLEGLKKAKVDVLICGNIDSISEGALEDMGVRLIPWVTGEAEGALACFLKGELVPGSIVGAQGVCGRWGVGTGRWGCRRGRWYQEIINEREQNMPRGKMNNQGRKGQQGGGQSSGEDYLKFRGRGRGSGGGAGSKGKGRGCRGGKGGGRNEN